MVAKMSTLRKAVSIVGYCVYLFIVIVAFDVFILKKLLNFGYPRSYKEENIWRYPAPYVAFIGKPGVAGHNELGFRGRSFRESDPSDLKVAFFGGSTGYRGKPPIAALVEKKLEQLLRESVFVANYSVEGSNHRQHLHGIIEFLPQFELDLVIFYGGSNETMLSGHHDPRPGYPYNYFYRAETKPFFKLLLEYSAIIGEIDKKLGWVTGLTRLRKEQRPFSADWNKRIVDKYFETLMLANKITNTMESRRFGKAKFLAFYQPYQVPEKFMSGHNDIRSRASVINYVYDASSAYDSLGKEIYRDSIHVNQQAKEIMAAKIATIVANELQ